MADIPEWRWLFDDQPDLINRQDVVRLFGITIRVWERLEYGGRGPPTVIIHKRLTAYRKDDLIAWIEARGGPPEKRTVQTPEERKAKKRKAGLRYYAATRADRVAASKAWREANPDRFKQTLRDWYQDNKDRQKEWGAAYYQANRERHDQASKEWRERNRERALEISLRAVHRRNAKIKTLEGSHTLGERDALLEKFEHRCAEPTCRRDIRGAVQWDHIVPITKGGTNWISNMQPLCKSCNSKKGNLLPEEWDRKMGRAA